MGRAAGTWGSWVSGPHVIIRGGGVRISLDPPVLAPNYKNNLIRFNNLFKLIKNYNKNKS